MDGYLWRFDIMYLHHLHYIETWKKALLRVIIICDTGKFAKKICLGFRVHLDIDYTLNVLLPNHVTFGYPVYMYYNYLSHLHFYDS